MATQVQHIGHKEAMRALRSLPDHMKERAAEVIEVTAFQFERMVNARIWVRTGATKFALDSRVNKRTPRGDVGFVGASRGKAPKRLGPRLPTSADVFYWKFQEYGTVHHKARPVFRPVAEALQEDHRRRMDRAMSQAGDDMVRSASSRLL